MPRKPRKATETPLPLPAPVVIHPNSVFQLDDARAVLRLNKTSLSREIRAGRLRVSRRAGRYYLLGIWLLQWLKGGERRREPADQDRPE